MLHSTIKYVPSTGTTTTGTYDTEFMEALSSVGKMISVRIYQGNSIIFNDSSINSTTISVDGSLLKSLMKTVEIELNGLYLLLDEEFSDIQVGVSGDRGQTYYYVSYGKFIVGPENEQVIETNTTKITCYDEMLNSMKTYDMEFNYSESTTNRDYFNAIANAIGLSVGSSIPSDGVMAKIRNHETYVDSNTYRDVLDDFAEILGGCIIVKDSKLELVKPTDTEITIDEDQLKSVNYKEIYDQVTNITLSRMPQEDNVHYPEQVGSGELIKIENNLLVEGYQDTSGVIDRTPYLEPIYNAISAWGSYYPIELESFGYCLYEPCDVFHISVKKADGTTTNLPIIWMSNSIKVSQGIEESMTSEAPESGETDYAKSSSSSLAERNTYLYVDKVEQTIEAKVSSVQEQADALETNVTSLTQDLSGFKTTVSNTYATKSALSTTNTNVSNLRSDLNTTNDNLDTLQGNLDSTNNTITTIQENVSTIQQTQSNIQTQVSQTQTTLVNNYATKSELSSSVSSLSTTIQQTASDITLTISDVQDVISSQGQQITTLETYIRATSRGLEISRSSDEVTMVLSNTELGFYNKANTKLAWLDSADGLGASALSIGDATIASNRWRIFTRQSGSHLTFTRHS